MSDCGFCGLPLSDQYGTSEIVCEVEVCEACIELAQMCWESETV